MSATSSGAGCGLVLGLVFALLAQQFGLLSLSQLSVGLEALIVGAVVGLLVGALIGWRLGARELARSRP